MLRFLFAGALVLATFQFGLCQDYEGKLEYRDKGQDPPTVINARVFVKKSGDDYTVNLDVAYKRDLDPATVQVNVLFVLFNDNFEPTANVIRMRLKGSSTGTKPAGSLGNSIEISAKQLQDTSGYIMVVKTDGKDFPFKRNVLEFLTKDIPSGQEIADAYKKLKAGDQSKAFGPVLIRKLK
jgi:hypothetical protein